MNQRPTIREQMDACRPDSDDLHLPEHAADLAELQAGLRESAEVRTQWERSQQDGRTIRSAMHDVSLPAGLEGRLLAAVQAAPSVPLAGVEKAVREETPLGDHLATPSPAKANRRWFTRVASGLVAACVLVGVVAFQNWPQREQQVSRDELASQAGDWLRAVNVSAMVKPTRAVTLPVGVLGPVAGSSSISSSQGSITAYSLTGTGGNSAILLVFPTSKSYPVHALPYSEIQGFSGPWEVGAWQRNGVLYLIAVPRDSGARLDDFVRRPQVG